MDRRHFLAMLAAGTAVAVSGCSRAYGGDSVPPDSLSSLAPPSPPSPPAPALLGPPALSARVPVPAGALTAIPGQGNNIALTSDPLPLREAQEPSMQTFVEDGYRDRCVRSDCRCHTSGVVDSVSVRVDARMPDLANSLVPVLSCAYVHSGLRGCTPARDSRLT